MHSSIVQLRLAGQVAVNHPPCAGLPIGEFPELGLDLHTKADLRILLVIFLQAVHAHPGSLQMID